MKVKNQGIVFLLLGAAVGAAALISSCGKRETPPQEQILVTINDTLTISVNEFLKRAEYTVRPGFCRRNDYVSKKIVLNSLIAEKLLALEAGDRNPLFENETFQKHMQGRKEQAMRQCMYHDQATRQVKVNDSEVERFYPLAGREYEIETYTLTDSLTAARLAKSAFSDSLFNGLFHHMAGDSARMPVRHVNWTLLEEPQLLVQLFQDDVRPGQILKPVKTGYNTHVWARVKGWTDTKAITEYQQTRRLSQIKEVLSTHRAGALWDETVGEIMRGKRIDFNRETFTPVCQIFKEKYFTYQKNKKEMLNRTVWDKEPDYARQLQEADEDLFDRPFFTVNETVWTVEDFRQELMRHPLVYRQRKMSASQFAREFKLAVVDLIRDHYITRAAYDQGYHQRPEVTGVEGMWKDAFAAHYQKQVILKKAGIGAVTQSNLAHILEDVFNPYLDELQKKHFRKIAVDFDAFEALELSRVDMEVRQNNQAFPDVVPRFPVITTDSYLEYVREM